MVQSLGWSPNGQLLGSGGADAQLLIWRKTDGQVLLRLPHQATVDAVAWSPESKRIATGSANQVAFFTAGTGELLAPVVHQHTDGVTSLAWTKGNQQQVVTGALDRRAIVWNTTNYSAQTIFTKHATAIEGVSWSPDGQTVASCSQGGIIRVWNAQSGLETHVPFQDGQEPLHAVAFAPIGTFLAVGGGDGQTRLWENGLLCHATQATHNGPVCQDAPLRLGEAGSSASLSVAWSPDGRFLAIGNNEGTCTLWSIKERQTLFAFAQADGQAIHSLSWSPAGDEIAIASSSIVTIWMLRP
jgi:WD40 repeat protein